MTATNYLMTTRGTLMPCTTEGVTTDTGLIEVYSPNGTLYTAAPQNVVSLEEGAQMLRHSRAEKLTAEGYAIEFIGTTGAVRMYQPKKHGTGGGYVLIPNANGDYACHCPSAGKVGPYECKHALGVFAMVAAARARQAECKARLAEMIARDGWD